MIVNPFALDRNIRGFFFLSASGSACDRQIHLPSPLDPPHLSRNDLNVSRETRMSPLNKNPLNPQLLSNAKTELFAITAPHAFNAQYHNALIQGIVPVTLSLCIP